MGFGGDKPLNAGTPALLPGVCSENSQDKRSAAIIRANKNADKKLWTKKKTNRLSEKELNLSGNSLITIFQSFPSRESRDRTLSYVLLK